MAQNESEIDAARDAADLLDLDQGDQVIVDGIDTKLTIFQKVYTGTMTHVGWKVIDEDLNLHKLRYVSADGGFIQYVRDGDTQPVYHVGNPDRIDDFEVVGNDTRPVEQYVAKIRERRGHK